MQLRTGNLSLPICGSRNKENSGIGVDLGNDRNLLVSVRHMLKKLLLLLMCFPQLYCRQGFTLCKLNNAIYNYIPKEVIKST